jgi:hypothetical protein
MKALWRTRESWWRLIAVGASAVACAALLYPGRGEGGLSVQRFFALPSDGGDALEISAHFLIFSLLTYLWHRAFPGSRHPLAIAVFIVIPLGFATEFSQSLVHRGVSFFDLLANLFAIAATSALIKR